MINKGLLPIIAICLTALLDIQAASAARIKDLVTIQGIRANQLVGYGLVVGLKGTGDSLRNAPFTAQSIRSMLDNMGLNVRGANPRTRNVAAVIVTAELPPFIGKGARIDVTVSSLGDASSLAGGSLVMTPLRAANQKIYAVAQGSIAVAGFASKGQAESLTHGIPTTGRIANGALIERETRAATNIKNLKLELRNPDFDTAIAIADRINAFSAGRYRVRTAHARNPRIIELRKPAAVSATRFIAVIGRLNIEPDTPARVVIDERTGTIVIGKNVRISQVAVTHGNLTVRVTETPQVVQPNPFGGGQTAVAPRSAISASQSTGNFALVKGADLETLVRGLNKMGLKPPGIIAILQAVKRAGALQAELVVQ